MKFYYQVKSTRNLDIKEDIFRDYPDSTYIVKLTKLNRPTIEIRSVIGHDLCAIAVLDKYNEYIKICLIIVHKCFKNRNLGNNLIRIVLNMFNNDFQDARYLYTVCPHQLNTTAYQQLLLKNNFQLSTIKANGDLVYTYERSIQKSD